MMALCLYTQFLLVSPSGNCDSKILYILDQVEIRFNPFPLILEETITGLDNFIKTRRFLGSPLLLEVRSLYTPFPNFLLYYHFYPFIALGIVSREAGVAGTSSRHHALQSQTLSDLKTLSHFERCSELVGHIS